MFELASGLVRLGHEVEVYATPYTLEGRRKVDRSLIYRDFLPYHEGVLNLVKADVAYMMYHPFAWANFVTKAPRIASFHSLVWFSRRREGYGLVPRTAAFLNDHLMQRELRRFSAVHVHYPQIAREVDRRAPSHPKTYTIGHFIDTEVFKPNGGKAKEKFTVLYLGRPVWQKGFDLFVRLAHELPEGETQFIFVGGETNDRRITSLGLIRDSKTLSETLSGAHLVVSPQRVVTIGKSSLEALACGTPVAIMTDSLDSPLRECGSVIRTNDYASLSNAVKQVHKEWRTGAYDEAALSGEARKCVVENFSFQKTIAQYEAMLREVASSS